MRASIFDGEVEIKCKRCGKINLISIGTDIYKASHFFLLISALGIIVDISKTIHIILDYSPSELIGKHITYIIPEFKKEIIKYFFDNIQNSNNYSFSMDAIFKTKAGNFTKAVTKFNTYSPAVNEKYLTIHAETTIKPLKITKMSTNLNGVFSLNIDQYEKIEYITTSMFELFGLTQISAIGSSYNKYFPALNEALINDDFIDNQLSFRSMGEKRLNKLDKEVTHDLYYSKKYGNAGNFAGYTITGYAQSSQKPK